MPWMPPCMTKKELIDRDVVKFIEYLKKEYDINRIQPTIEISNGNIKICGGYIGVGISSDGSVDYEIKEWSKND